MLQIVEQAPQSKPKAEAKDASTTASAKPLPAKRITSEMPAERAVVLLAEDSRLVRAATSRALRRNGFEVVEVADGREALDMAISRDFHIAIVDLGLPSVNGIEVVAAVKERRGNETSVLVMSGNISPDVKVNAFDAGADDYVCKPVHMPELLRRVQAFRRTQLAYLEAKRARERLEQMSLYASEAAALLAHDLSNGLAIALGNMDFLNETEPETGDDDRDEALVSTTRALRRMSGLVRNFVELRQLEDAALIPKPSNVDMGEMLGDVAGLHRHEIQPRGARISVDCAPDLYAPVDPTLVERLVHNLVGNAIRYVDHGGRIRLVARVEQRGSKAELVIEVGNTGSDIPAEMRSTLFDKYRTGGDSGSQRGMGLYFCRLASEAHGGQIAVESRGDYHANFVVRIPVERPNVSPPGDAPPANARPRSSKNAANRMTLPGY